MKAAVIQINSGADRARNIEVAGSLVGAAAKDGADFVVLPEKWALLGDGNALTEGAETLDGEAVSTARYWAVDHELYVLAGSFTEISGQGLPTNTSVLIAPTGQIMARYEKLHMFDVEAGGVRYRESDHERAGEGLALADVGELVVGSRSVTTCASPNSSGPCSTGAQPLSRFLQPSPRPPAVITGSPCSGPGRSRTRPSSSPPIRSGPPTLHTTPGATR